MKPPSFVAPRRRRRPSNAPHKDAALASGKLRCEICGYFNNSYPPYGLIEAHHIRRRIDGGSDSSHNIIMLCPTHHSEADRLSRQDTNLTRHSLVSALSRSFPRPHGVDPMPVDVETIKADLLANPLTAHALAVERRAVAANFPHPELAQAYDSIIAQFEDMNLHLVSDDAAIHPHGLGPVPDASQIKDHFLSVPVTAYGKVESLARRYREAGQNRLADLYDVALQQLRDEGYAPDPSAQPGPAVIAHYRKAVLGK